MKYQCHINVERTQGVVAVTHLTKYAFKGPSQRDIKVRTSNERHRSSSRDPSKGNIRNGIRLYMRARLKVSFEVTKSLFEYHYVKFDLSVTAYKIHLEHQRNQIIQNSSTFPKKRNDSQLVRYFKKPLQYHCIPFLDYMKQH